LRIQQKDRNKNQYSNKEGDLEEKEKNDDTDRLRWI